MIIFIDESGDAGFKIQKGSSLTFVVALVIFDDELDAEETALKIKKLKKTLRKSGRFEFKFNKSNKDIRIQFLESVKNCKFRIRAIVLQKEKIYSKVLRSSKDKFYNYVIKSALDNNQNSIRNAKIRLDGLGEKSFKQNLIAYLRRNQNQGSKTVMKNLKFRDSRKDVLIQLADMVAGAIRRSYDLTKSDHKIYKKILKKRVEDEWNFQ